MAFEQERAVGVRRRRWAGSSSSGQQGRGAPRVEVRPDCCPELGVMEGWVRAGSADEERPSELSLPDDARDVGDLG